MKLAISTLSCPRWTLQQIVQTCADNGISGIDFRGLGEEIDITKLPQFNDDLDQTLALLRQRGLAMPCLNTSIVLVTPAPDRWQMMLEEARRSARLAARTGTRLLRIFGGRVPKDLSRQQAAMLGQRHLRQLIKIVAPGGCVLALETHDDWSRSDEALEMIHEFDPQEVGVLWDIEHPYRRGETPADTFSTLRRFIKHLHVKDSVRVEEKNQPRLLGQGDVPIGQCVHLLREGGFDGWYSLECEKRWHADAPDPEASIPHFAAFMRELLKS